MAGRNSRPLGDRSISYIYEELSGDSSYERNFGDYGTVKAMDEFVRQFCVDNHFTPEKTADLFDYYLKHSFTRFMRLAEKLKRQGLTEAGDRLDPNVVYKDADDAAEWTLVRDDRMGVTLNELTAHTRVLRSRTLDLS